MKAPILISVAEDANGYVVTDGRGREHHAIDAARLGPLIVELMADPSLPRAKVEKRNDFVGIVAGLARRVVPQHAELVDAAEPVGHQLTTIAPMIRRVWPSKEDSVE